MNGREMTPLPTPVLPKDYLAYVEAGGADCAFTDGDPGYFQLWPPEEIERWNQDYGVPKWAPGFLGFGSDGGGEMLAFNSAGAVFMIPFVGMSVADAKEIGESWSEVASRISDEKEA